MMETANSNIGAKIKTRHKLISLLSKVQDNGEVWYVEDNGCNRVDIVRNAVVIDFLIANGVGFVTDINDGHK